MFNYLNRLLTFLGLAFLFASSVVADEIRGWYELGGTMIQNATLETFGNETLTGNSVKFDVGFRAGIGLGMNVTRNIALEVESGYHYNDIRSIEGASNSPGNLSQVPAMANIVLHFPNRTRIEPVFGAGVGAVYSMLDANNLRLGTTTIDGHADTWSFAFQGYAGLVYQFRPDMGIGVTYHYLYNDAPTWDYGPGINVKLNRVINQSLSLTLHFSF